MQSWARSRIHFPRSVSYYYRYYYRESYLHVDYYLTNQFSFSQNF